MPQLDFLDDRPKSAAPPSAPYVKRSETSKAAARAVAPQTGHMRAEVLRLLLEHPAGLTDEELEHELRPPREGSTRARRCELVSEGRVVDSGRTRLGGCGRPMTVWVARSSVPSPSHPVTPSPSPHSGGRVVVCNQGPPPIGGAHDDAGQGEAPGDRCPKCKGTEFVDVPIHGGRSVRRECRHCHRFLKFVAWYGGASA